MKPENTHAPSAADTVTVDEVAAVALKIGQEIWGEEQFSELMNAADLPETTVYSVVAVGPPSAPAPPYRGKHKKEPA